MRSVVLCQGESGSEVSLDNLVGQVLHDSAINGLLEGLTSIRDGGLWSILGEESLGSASGGSALFGEGLISDGVEVDAGNVDLGAS